MKAKPSLGQPVEFVVSLKTQEPDGYRFLLQTSRVIVVADTVTTARKNRNLLNNGMMLEPKTFIAIASQISAQNISH